MCLILAVVPTELLIRENLFYITIQKDLGVITIVMMMIIIQIIIIHILYHL